MPVTDQGVHGSVYSLIPRTLTFLVNNQNVLLIKGAPDKRLWADLYNGIGGHIEPGEDVISSAKREFIEETGLEPLDLRLCGVITIDTGPEIGVGIYVLKGEKFSGSMSSSIEGSLEWVDTGLLEQIPLVEDLMVLLPRILHAGKDTPPFSATYSYADDGKLQITFFQP